MALKRNERYPGRFANPSTAHPQGAFQNRTSPTSQDGSYLEADWANDADGFIARILNVAGVTPNGTVDDGTSSQVYDAMVVAVKSFLGSAAQRNVGTGTNFIPDMSSFTSGVSGASFWQRLPSGMLMQYGYVFNMSSGAITITYPVAFSNQLRSLLVTPTGNVGANSVNSAVPSLNPATGTSLTAFSVTGYNASTGGTPQISNVLFYWEAIGV